MNPYSLSYYREDTKSIRESDQSDLMSGNLDDLDGLRALDHQVIAAVHKRFFPEIFRYVRYRLGNEIIAEDITGEVAGLFWAAKHELELILG